MKHVQHRVALDSDGRQQQQSACISCSCGALLIAGAGWWNFVDQLFGIVFRRRPPACDGHFSATESLFVQIGRMLVGLDRTRTRTRTCHCSLLQTISLIGQLGASISNGLGPVPQSL